MSSVICKLKDSNRDVDNERQCLKLSFFLTFNVSFQVRTLFVSGLPMDAKPRELYLLFRAYEVGNNLNLSGYIFNSPAFMAQST